MSNLFLIVPVLSVAALLVSLILTLKIMKTDEGTDRMKEIAAAVREGAAAYLNRQYRAVGVFFAVVFLLLLFLSFKELLVIIFRAP